MILVFQRVKSASVIIDEAIYSEINSGILISIGISKKDKVQNLTKIIDQIVTMETWEDELGSADFNKLMLDFNPEILVVSQFTLNSTLKRKKLDHSKSASFKTAKQIYTGFIDEISNRVSTVKSGKFGSFMTINSSNVGPVTLVLDM
jgi:D-tyrosyl-tRNA(Tyr) deacylase